MRSPADLFPVKGSLRMSFQSDRAGSNTTLNTEDSGNAIDTDRLKAHLRQISVHLDILQHRLELEARMWQMIVKLPNFLLYFLSFLVGLYTLSPASATSMVNRQLVDYFELNTETLDDVSTMDDIYDFLSKFRQKNEELMASSPEYWCESRYMTHNWNISLAAPSKTCQSPRMYALGHQDDNQGVAWSSLYTGDLNGTTSSDWPQEGTDCDNNETRLKELLNDQTATCRTVAKEVCESSIAFKACRSTCGYCPPFVYERRAAFVVPSKTLLPMSVHQSRMKEKECKGFSLVLDAVAPNEHLISTPSLDGERDGELVSCIKMDSEQDDQWDKHVECPASMIGSSYCPDGWFQHTQKVMYLDHPVYAQLIQEQSREIETMKAVHWLDIYTKDVSVSTLVYSQVHELFTMVVVTFHLDSAGHVQAEKSIMSGRDLINHEPYIFVGSMVLSIFICAIGHLHPVWDLVRHGRCPNWLSAYELISRTCMIVFIAVLLVDWSLERSYSSLFQHVLVSFVGSLTTGEEHSHAMLEDYYETLEEVKHHKDRLNSFRIFAYLLLYMQFVQLMLYFAFHPRMGIITATISKASSALAHFGVLFSMIFSILAFMAHWMLGTHVDEFATFSGACAAQARMLFGEFIYVESADELDGSMVIMYWLYAFSFMLVVYFTLLNFFLAIVVDAFAQVKLEEESHMTEHDFLIDIWDVLWSAWSYRMNRQNWPSQSDVLRALQAREALPTKTNVSAFEMMEQTEKVLVGHEEQRRIVKCTAAEFGNMFKELKGDKDALASFLRFYYLKVPVVLSKTKTAKPRSSISSKSSSWHHIQSSSFIEMPETASHRVSATSSESEWQPQWMPHLYDVIDNSPFKRGPQVADGVDWELEAITLAHRISKAVREFQQLAGHRSNLPGPLQMQLLGECSDSFAQGALQGTQQNLKPQAAAVLATLGNASYRRGAIYGRGWRGAAQHNKNKDPMLLQVPQPVQEDFGDSDIDDGLPADYLKAIKKDAEMLMVPSGSRKVGNNYGSSNLYGGSSSGSGTGTGSFETRETTSPRLAVPQHHSAQGGPVSRPPPSAPPAQQLHETALLHETSLLV
mmetsp:Transcript_2993/g.7259  ORF Transcript_2993/g.7259 Transcript_2993/m.7259 type:complete len:1083 (+) Transcript_2993:86-3334(+)